MSYWEGVFLKEGIAPDVASTIASADGQWFVDGSATGVAAGKHDESANEALFAAGGDVCGYGAAQVLFFLGLGLDPNPSFYCLTSTPRREQSSLPLPMVGGTPRPQLLLRKLGTWGPPPKKQDAWIAYGIRAPPRLCQRMPAKVRSSLRWWSETRK